MNRSAFLKSTLVWLMGSVLCLFGCSESATHYEVDAVMHAKQGPGLIVPADLKQTGYRPRFPIPKPSKGNITISLQPPV